MLKVVDARCGSGTVAFRMGIQTHTNPCRTETTVVMCQTRICLHYGYAFHGTVAQRVYPRAATERGLSYTHHGKSRTWYGASTGIGTPTVCARRLSSQVDVLEVLSGICTFVAVS